MNPSRLFLEGVRDTVAVQTSFCAIGFIAVFACVIGLEVNVHSEEQKQDGDNDKQARKNARFAGVCWHWDAYGFHKLSLI
jgi:hypothetical protein